MGWLITNRLFTQSLQGHAAAPLFSPTYILEQCDYCWLVVHQLSVEDRCLWERACVKVKNVAVTWIIGTPLTEDNWCYFVYIKKTYFYIYTVFIYGEEERGRGGERNFQWYLTSSVPVTHCLIQNGCLERGSKPEQHQQQQQEQPMQSKAVPSLPQPPFRLRLTNWQQNTTWLLFFLSPQSIHKHQDIWGFAVWPPRLARPRLYCGNVILVWRLKGSRH